MTEKTEEQLRRQFRSSVDVRAVSAPAQIDPVIGSYFVHWRLIQHSFPSLRHGDDNVYCLVGPETLEDRLLPLRIHYYPGVVRGVIQGDSSLSSSETGDGAISHFSTSSHKTNTSSWDNDDDENIGPHQWPLQRQSTNHLEETGLGKSLVHCSKHMAPHGQDYAASFTNLYESYVEAMPAGGDQQIESIKTRMDAAMDSMLASLMEKDRENKELQKHMLKMLEDMEKKMEKNQAQLLEKDRENKEMQKQMLEMQEDMEKKMEKNQAQLLEKDRENKEMQKQMLEMQKEALSRLVDIQNRAQALFTLTYELFEYQIPRLFIVLPTQQSRYDRLNPLNDNFRLYFLCECGEHTKNKSSSSKVPHHIHLAKHVGYELQRPTEFFQKYGSYLLTMMEMVKFGVGIAGLVVPTLAQLKILDGIDGIKNQLDFTEKTFAPLLDDSISYVRKHIGQDLPDAELESGRDLAIQGALEGAELRQLESYLNTAGEAKTLGNLYRTKTDDGHVKWVCLDHYHDGYMDSIQPRFANIVASNKGEFMEGLGKVTISLSTPLKAQEFYDALRIAKGVLELTINPLWDATKSDIQQLCDAIFRSNVSLLDVGGGCFNSPNSDVFNRGSRFDPFIQLLASGKLRSFTIKDCPRFPDRISDIASPVAPKLLALNLYYHYSVKELKTVRQKIVVLLQQIPSLTEATVGCLDIDEMFELLPIEQLQRLPVLHLQHMRYSNKATLVLSNGAMKHMDLVADNVPELAYSGFLRQFEMVAGIISLTDLERLLGTNMGLTKLHLMKAENFFEYIFLIDTLMLTRCNPLQVVLKDNKNQSIKMEFWDAAKVPLLKSTGKWIQLAHSVVHVQEWDHTSYNFQHVNSDTAVFLSQLEEMTDGENFVLLDLDISSLTAVGIKAMRRTMTYLRPRVCHVAFKRYKQEWAHCYDFDPMCWSKLLKLKVSGEDIVIWLQNPGSAFRRGLLRSLWCLQYLTIQGQRSQPFLSDDLTDWLACMASKGYSQSLKGLTISYARFSHESWRTILRSIDYSNLQSLHLRQCDLAGALPGSRNDAAYTAADLCRYVGLRTDHLERAAKFVLAQGTGDNLTFKRKSNSTVQGT